MESTNTQNGHEKRMPLTHEQRRHTASRMLHAASLIEGGAEIKPTGGVQVTERQYKELLGESIAEAHADFMENTRDGHIIDAQGKTLGRLSERIKPSSHARLRTQNLADERAAIDAWIRNNDLDINLQTYNADDPAQFAAMQTKIEGMRDGLHKTSLTLLEFPQLRIGSEVKVMRNSQNGPYPESGWRVEEILADGRLQVGTPDGKMLKRPSPADLAAWNNLGEPSYTDAVIPPKH